jgi:hypothetical protein
MPGQTGSPDGKAIPQTRLPAAGQQMQLLKSPQQQYPGPPDSSRQLASSVVQPPSPLSKQGPSPRAPALMHSPRSRPGGKFSLQSLAQALLPPLAAQAIPGMEAKAPPTRAAPISLSALRRDIVPLANPLASSSKECSPVWSSAAMRPIPFSALTRAQLHLEPAGSRLRHRLGPSS